MGEVCKVTMPGGKGRGKGLKRPRSDDGQQDKGTKRVSNGCAKTKKTIRDVERLLRKETLAADFRAAQEQRLSVLKGQLEHQQAAFQVKETEIKMTAKYKRVKFFEKQKVNRRLNQFAKKDELTEEESSERQRYQRDLFYIANFPKDQPYISLYVAEEKDTDEVKAKREAIRATIDVTYNKLHHSKHAVDEEEVEKEETHEQAAGEADGGEAADDFFLEADDDGGVDGEEATPKKGKKKKKKKIKSSEEEVEEVETPGASSSKKKKKKKKEAVEEEEAPSVPSSKKKKKKKKEADENE